MRRNKIEQFKTELLELLNNHYITENKIENYINEDNFDFLNKTFLPEVIINEIEIVKLINRYKHFENDVLRNKKIYEMTVHRENEHYYRLKMKFMIFSQDLKNRDEGGYLILIFYLIKKKMLVNRDIEYLIDHVFESKKGGIGVGYLREYFDDMTDVHEIDELINNEFLEKRRKKLVFKKFNNSKFYITRVNYIFLKIK
jgi:hypothetical protein